jgi:hypothetical protein
MLPVYSVTYLPGCTHDHEAVRGDRVRVAVIGQGTWEMGESRRTEKDEIAALRLGIELGMTHIDTAEMYADGGSERVVGQAVKGRRAGVFITTKVWPDNASYAGALKACSPPLFTAEACEWISSAVGSCEQETSSGPCQPEAPPPATPRARLSCAAGWVGQAPGSPMDTAP